MIARRVEVTERRENDALGTVDWLDKGGKSVCLRADPAREESEAALAAARADAAALVDERDELARHIDDADAVAATLRRQVADLGTERDAHELDAKKSGRRVRELEREAEAAVVLKRQLVSLKTDRDDLQTMSDARSAALHRRVSEWTAVRRRAPRHVITTSVAAGRLAR